MDEQRRIFSTNLLWILSQRNKTQSEVADAIGVSHAAMNMWCNGVTFPRMPKIQKLADYLNVTASQLIDPPERQFDIVMKDEDSEFIVEMKSIEGKLNERQLKHLIEYAKWYAAKPKED